MKIFVFLLAISISSLSIAKETSPEDIYGTYSVSFQPLMIQGKTQFCLLNFASIIKSSLYERDANYYVGGSFGVGATENRSNIVVTLKVVNNKVDLTKPGAIQTPKRPYFAYLIAPNGINNSAGFLGSDFSDSPGGLTSGYNFDDASVEIFTQIINTKKVSIAFNLNKGDVDIVVPLDLTITGIDEKGRAIKSNNAILEFKKCMVPLFRETAKNMEKAN